MVDRKPPSQRPVRSHAETDLQEEARQVIDSLKVKADEQERKWRLQLEAQEAYSNALRLPAHSSVKDLRGAYTLNLDVLRTLNDQLETLLKQTVKWTVTFAGDHSVSAESFDQFAGLPILQTRPYTQLTFYTPMAYTYPAEGG